MIAARTMAARCGFAACLTLVATDADASVAETAPASRYRLPFLGRAPIAARDNAPVVTLQRRTVRAGGVTLAALRGEPRTLSYDLQSRSRVTMLRADNRFAIDDRLAASIGWHGVKISNRNANVALGGGANRLSARDWFLPRATISYRATSRFGLALDYCETMRGFEGTGTIGPFGMTQAAFDTLRDTLRPERARRVRLDGAWQLSDVRLSMGGFSAALRDPIDRADRSFRPVSGGSVALSGVGMAVEHRVAPQLVWAGYYQHAAGRMADVGGLREDELGIRGSWTDGPWRGSFRVARAVSTLTARSAAAAARIEAAIDYETLAIAGRPVHVSARLIDPGPLASMRAMEDNGSVRAGDGARRMMVQARMTW